MTKVDKPRKTITHEMLDELELQAHLIRSVERYAYIRQWLYGDVLDCGCGTGYGSYMIAQNPDVISVIGLDNDESVIEFAEREYQDEKLTYICEDATSLKTEFDWLVAVELIEHLRQPERFADAVNAARILLTYPSKKTTHYNPFHVKDYNDGMIAELFPKYQIYKTYDFHATHDTRILFLKRKESEIPGRI